MTQDSYPEAETDPTNHNALLLTTTHCSSESQSFHMYEVAKIQSIHCCQNRNKALSYTISYKEM